MDFLSQKGNLVLYLSFLASSFHLVWWASSLNFADRSETLPVYLSFSIDDFAASSASIEANWARKAALKVSQSLRALTLT